MDAITNVLFSMANGLLVPVILLLLLLLLRALWVVAGFFGEYARHTRQLRWLKPLLDDSTPFRDEELVLPSVIDTPMLRCLKRLVECRASAVYCERLLANYEVEAERSLGHARLLVKMGPMLGLMGTLIPMGPALVGLSGGDLASMAYHMQMAFATTVVGLLIAAVGVVTLQVKRCWYARDLNDLEYLYRRLADGEVGRSQEELQ